MLIITDNTITVKLHEEREYIKKFESYIMDTYNKNLINYNEVATRFDIWTNTIKMLVENGKIDNETIHKVVYLCLKYNKVNDFFKDSQLLSCQNDFCIYMKELKSILKKLIINSA